MITNLITHPIPFMAGAITATIITTFIFGILLIAKQKSSVELIDYLQKKLQIQSRKNRGATPNLNV